MRSSSVGLICLAAEDVVQYIHDVLYEFNSLSGHASLRFMLGPRVAGRGGRVWCLNAGLLKEDKYIDLICRYINNELNNLFKHVNIGGWWEKLKDTIKNVSIKYASRRNYFKERGY